MTKKHKKGVVISIVLLIVILISLGLMFLPGNFGGTSQPIFGATFSTLYAKELGLNWREVFTASLDDLGIRHYRLPAYWLEIEPTNNQYSFADLDWLLDEADKRQAKVILAVGLKLPRWPECHFPSWAKELEEKELKTEILSMLQEVVTRYNDHPAVTRWQVENEALFNFGECPRLGREFLKQEVELVRSLSDKPIVVTDSGELSTWLRTASLADILGISMYRVTWNKYLGYFYYPIKPGYYYTRSHAIKPLVDDVIVTELQVEPWTPSGILNTSLEDQYLSMDLARFENNIEFASRAGFSEVYLWGIEWWYWLLHQGESRLWEAGRLLWAE